MSSTRDNAAETERVRKLQDREAPRYDRNISIFERILFGDGRHWVCAQATGDVLEVAIGSGRNLPLYPQDITDGIEDALDELAHVAHTVERIVLKHA